MKYDTIKALAVAIYAFQQNENSVIKEARQNQDGDILCYANKHYLESTMEGIVHNPLYPKAIVITPDLITQANELKTSFEYMITMTSLVNKGRINKFVNDVYQLVMSEQLQKNNFGLVVWAPKIMSDYEKASAIRVTSAGYEHSSKYIGRVGERVTLNFNLIEKRYIRSINVWSAYGHDDAGNLISFLSKKEDLIASGSIKARIKACEQSSYHNNARITQLNHVKAV